MKGQEHTVMGYLVWAAFFVVVMGVLYAIFNTQILTATPTPMDQIVDLFTSAVQAYEAGISQPVCLNVYPGGSLTLTSDFVERITGESDVHFRCLGAGCDTTADSMTISGRTGLLCVEVNGDGVFVTWR